MISSLRRPFLRSASAVKRWYSVSSCSRVEREAQILAALGQRVAAAVLAQHQLAFPGTPTAVRVDDLVGGPLFQIAILVDAGFVRERVLADDGLVGLRAESDDRGQHLAGGERCSVTMRVSNGSRSRRVFIAMTTSSSAALPARSPMPLMVHSICRAPRLHGRQRIRHRQAQIVVAVHADDGGIAQRLHHPADHRAVFLRHREPDGIRQVHRARARGDHRARNLLPGNPNRCASRLRPKTRRRRTYSRASVTAATASSRTCCRDFFSLYFR